MDGTGDTRISVIDPIGPACSRVKEILFQPFNIEKWFVIGFCAWLSILCDGGGGGGGNIRNVPSRGDLNHAKEAFLENLPWLIPAVVFFFIIGIALGILLLWVSSRGKFMFLHCVATNRAEVKVPWNKYRREGDSLFLFRLVVGIISFVCFVPLIVFTIFLIFMCAENDGANLVPLVAGIVISILLMIILVVCFGILNNFTNDFVVPIMLLGIDRCVDGWRGLLSILSINKCKFLLYVLFQILIVLTIGGIIFALSLFTCGCACCLTAIPYIGTVLLLPILVFMRSYSLYYLRQYGSAFDVFVSRPEAVEEVSS
ncbi:MAG: DUF7544 domain-containing protein [Planctomycetota bacterium]|jgi:hypothetical protein